VLDGGSMTVWMDADSDAAPATAGETVTYMYTVTNTGAVGLTDVILVDDNGTADDTSDDFEVVGVLVDGYNVGDIDQDGVLDVGEEWVYMAVELAVPGEHTSSVTVTARAVLSDGTDLGVVASDSDSATYVA
jgi:hypothetical protein